MNKFVGIDIFKETFDTISYHHLVVQWTTGQVLQAPAIHHMKK